MNKIMIVLLTFGLLVGCTPTVEEEGVARVAEPTSKPTIIPSPTPIPTPIPINELMNGVELVVSTVDDILAHWQAGELHNLTGSEGISSTIWSSPLLTDDKNYVAFEQDNSLFCIVLEGNNLPTKIPLPKINGYEANIHKLETISNHAQLIVSGWARTDAWIVDHVFLVDCATQEIVFLTDISGRLIPSPDGKTVAIASSDLTYTINLSNGGITPRFEHDWISTYAGYADYPTVVWSPPSDKLIALIHPQDWLHEQRDDPTVIYEIDAKTDDVREIVKINQMGVHVREPHINIFSDSTEWLVYSTVVRSDENAWDIVESHNNIINLTTLDRRMILEDETAVFHIAKQTVWSPNDAYLVYATEQVYVGENTFPSPAPLKVVRLVDDKVFDVDESAIFHGWVRDDAFVYTADSAVKLAKMGENNVVSYTILEGVTQIHDVTSTYP